MDVSQYVKAFYEKTRLLNKELGEWIQLEETDYKEHYGLENGLNEQ